MARVEARIVDASVDLEGRVRFWLWMVFDDNPGIDIKFWITEEEAKRLVTRIVAGLHRLRRERRSQLEPDDVQGLIGRWLEGASGPW